MRIGTFFLHIILFVFTVVMVGKLLLLNTVPSGDTTYVQRFDRRNPFVSDLWPPESLLPLQEGVRPFTKDEVTFFIRPSRHFERAQVGITFAELPPGLTPQLFIQTSADAGTWQEIEWQYTTPAQPTKGAYYQATFLLDAHWRNPSKRYNMKIRVAGLEQQRMPALVDEISARFLDPTANVGNFWHLLRK